MQSFDKDLHGDLYLKSQADTQENEYGPTLFHPDSRFAIKDDHQAYAICMNIQDYGLLIKNYVHY